MALHELATNSVKHGALSGPGGGININWHLTDERLFLEWCEIDGPEIRKVARSGFGRTVLEQIVPVALEGESDLTFRSKEVRWTLSAPLRSVLAQLGMREASLAEAPNAVGISTKSTLSDPAGLKC
jgi:two-component sensor histidine kinase